jgi:hypothetical protein
MERTGIEPVTSGLQSPERGRAASSSIEQDVAQIRMASAIAAFRPRDRAERLEHESRSYGRRLGVGVSVLTTARKGRGRSQASLSSTSSPRRTPPSPRQPNPGGGCGSRCA